MNIRHEQEIKQFRDLFSQEGVDEFEKRFQILETFLSMEAHVTSEELAHQLKQDRISMDLDFVEATMELLCKFGFANKLKLKNGPLRYEHRHLGLHHDHMICTKCGKIIEFRDEALEKKQVQLAAVYGFHMLQHKMMIYGLCSDCLKKRALIIPLERAKQGEHLKIESLEGGRKAQMRLTSMGLRPGDIIDVVSTQKGGHLVIASGHTRFVVGQGLAQKIMVTTIDNLPCAESLKADSKAGPLKTMLLSEMKQGQEGIIAKVGGHGILRRRLLEMGINRGTKVHVEKYAPLKDPLEIIIKGYHVSLRVEEAANIIVENIVQENNR